MLSYLSTIDMLLSGQTQSVCVLLAVRIYYGCTGTNRTLVVVTIMSGLS